MTELPVRMESLAVMAPMDKTASQECLGQSVRPGRQDRLAPQVLQEQLAMMAHPSSARPAFLAKTAQMEAMAFQASRESLVLKAFLALRVQPALPEPPAFKASQSPETTARMATTVFLGPQDQPVPRGQTEPMAVTEQQARPA